jgi:hypothetical protein
MSVDSLITCVNRGKDGRNIGISTGMDKLDNVIFGIQRRYIYCIGADTSGGKTSFALDTFVYNLIKNANGTPISILYYSFEMSSDVMFAKLLSRYIFDEYKEVITFEEILSLREAISEEKYSFIKKSIPWLKALEKKLIIYDKSLTPNGIYATCKKWLTNFGEFQKIGEHKEEFLDNYPEMYKVVLIDHMGLIGGSGTKKERIDTTVDYMIYFRNKCYLTGIFIQQMNRNSKSMDRKLNNYELYQIDDFRDTSSTTDAAEVVIALYFPHREKIAKCEGYPIANILKKRFRLCQLLKNRYGQADVNIGMGFYGEIGMFKDLPRPEEIGDYEPYLSLQPEIIKTPDYLNKQDDRELNVFKM